MTDGDILRLTAFRRFWIGASASALGTSITAVALPVLVVTVLGSTPFEVGLVGAAQYLPYAVLGLFAGVLVDRMPRRPLLIAASIGRAFALALIPLLWWIDALSLGALIGLLLAFGVCNVVGFAASQSLLPRLVPRGRLLEANVRLDQSDAVVLTAGPGLGGAIVQAVGAPIAFAVDAASYVIEALMVTRVDVAEPAPTPGRRRVRTEIAEGLRWAYRRPVLAPLAASTHVWFVANAAALTAFATFALRDLALAPLALGFVMAFGGVATFGGTLLATRTGHRLGPGRTILGSRILYPFGWAIVVLAGGAPEALAPAVVALGLATTGFAAGIENSSEMALRQTATPDELLGRVNAVLRAANRTSAAVGAILGGLAATWLGTTTTLLACAGLLVVAALLLIGSRMRATTWDDLG